MISIILFSALHKIYKLKHDAIQACAKCVNIKLRSGILISQIPYDAL